MRLLSLLRQCDGHRFRMGEAAHLWHHSVDTQRNQFIRLAIKNRGREWSSGPLTNVPLTE